MKKFFLYAAVAVMTMTGFTSCDNDDDVPEYEKVEVSKGVYVVNAGRSRGNVPGSLTYYDYATGKEHQNVFQAANERALGVTANDAVVYGSKMYIIVSGEKTVEIVDAKTLKSVEQIKVADYLKTVGADEAQATPRHALADGGFVYVSTYAGKVVAIDTLTNQISKSFDCGSYSEGMAVQDGNLYVADSDYGNGNATISKINLATGKTETIKNEYTVNVVDIKTWNNRIFFLDSGGYDANWNQSGQGIYELMADNSAKKLLEATLMDISADGMIYAVNAPYTYPATAPTFPFYNLNNDASGTFISGNDIVSACAIAVDPQNGNVFVTSYSLNPDTQSADYGADGYAIIYSPKGDKVAQFTTGVGPSGICFNTGVEMKQK